MEEDHNPTKEKTDVDGEFEALAKHDGVSYIYIYILIQFTNMALGVTN